MAKNFGHFDLAKGEMTVNGGWLKRFWLEAQNCMLGSAVEGIRADNPCDLVVLSDEEAAELMPKRVWLDDVRPMPKEGFDIWIKTAEEAIELIEAGGVGFMSFDHDLGFNTKTMMCDKGVKNGYDVAKRVEELAAEGTLPRFGWAVHSMNPSGAERIEMTLKSADRFWASNERCTG